MTSVKQASAILARLKPLLFLDAYDIGVRQRSDAQFTADGCQTAAAHIAVGRPYLQAEIYIRESFNEKSPADQEYIILHELLHIVVDPLYWLLCDAQQDKNVTNREREFTREEAVDWFARIVLNVRSQKEK